MAKHYIPQTFRSIDELKQVAAVSLPHPHDWRLIAEPVVGSINALPQHRGVAIATNGILVLLLREDKFLIGHMDFFVADTMQSVAKPQATTTPKPKVVRHATRDDSEFY